MKRELDTVGSCNLNAKEAEAGGTLGLLDSKPSLTGERPALKIKRTVPEEQHLRLSSGLYLYITCTHTPTGFHVHTDVHTLSHVCSYTHTPIHLDLHTHKHTKYILFATSKLWPMSLANLKEIRHSQLC